MAKLASLTDTALALPVLPMVDDRDRTGGVDPTDTTDDTESSSPGTYVTAMLAICSSNSCTFLENLEIE
jgi:hypothetical protein